MLEARRMPWPALPSVLFWSKREGRMLALYHYDRSTAAQRVRLALEEKGLAWESLVVDTAEGDASQLPARYHELNPKGLVPVLVHDGRALSESLVILEYLEDVFAEPSLRPAAPFERARMRLRLTRNKDMGDPCARASRRPVR